MVPARLWTILLIGNYFAFISSVPVKENEKSGLMNDFQLPELCEDLKDDKQKKENCGKCFTQVSDIEDKSSIGKCIPHLSSKVADCVKKTLQSNSGERNLEKCKSSENGYSKESAEKETLFSAAESLPVEKEKDDEENDDNSKDKEKDDVEKQEEKKSDETLDDTNVKTRMVQEFWVNYGSSLALKSLLQLIQENDHEQFMKVYSIVKPCKNATMPTNATNESADASEIVETISEQTMKSEGVKSDRSNDTIDNEKKQKKKQEEEKKMSGTNARRRRQTDTEPDTEPEVNDEICDLTHLVPELTRCILTTLLEHKDIIKSIQPHLMMATTPIPAEIVKVLLESTPTCKQA